MAGAAAVFAGEGGCSVVLYGFDDALCKTGDALDLGGDDDLGGLAVGGGGESLQRAQTQHRIGGGGVVPSIKELMTDPKDAE